MNKELDNKIFEFIKENRPQILTEVEQAKDLEVPIIPTFDKYLTSLGLSTKVARYYKNVFYQLTLPDLV